MILGLNRNTGQPCGFCFVEYYLPEDAQNSIKFLDKTKLDGRLIRVDQDPGFEEGRQYGRGRHGGQVRDTHRVDYDEQRGGWGHGNRMNRKRTRNFNSGGNRPNYRQRKTGQRDGQRDYSNL